MLRSNGFILFTSKEKNRKKILIHNKPPLFQDPKPWPVVEGNFQHLLAVLESQFWNLQHLQERNPKFSVTTFTILEKVQISIASKICQGFPWFHGMPRFNHFPNIPPWMGVKESWSPQMTCQSYKVFRDEGWLFYVFSLSQETLISLMRCFIEFLGISKNKVPTVTTSRNQSWLQTPWILTRLIIFKGHLPVKKNGRLEVHLQRQIHQATI